MLTELSDVVGMEVYTDKGISLGNIDDVILETDRCAIESLYISNPNPLVVENSYSVAVPFRWVAHVGDIVLLKYFPKWVPTSGAPQDETAMQKLSGAAHHAGEKLVTAERKLADRLKTMEHKLEGEKKQN
jgi:sporulation protein YlmC with PRC-barrel domain